MARIPGPSITWLDERGDAVARATRRVLTTVISTATRSLPDRPSVDDLGLIPTLWRDATITIVDHVIDAYYGGAQVVDAGLVAILARSRVAAADVRASPIPRVTNAHVEAYLTTATNRLVNVGNEIWENARAGLVAGLRAGEGTGQLRDRVRATVGVSTRRAEAIARTEVNGAANAGAIDQLRVVQVPATKEWLATTDARTRPDHRHVEGEVVDLNAKFTVGGYPLDRPHDPTAPASETVNCRCTLIFEVGDDELFDLYDPVETLVAAGDHGEKLREYWVHGDGAAKIRWGQPGDFNRCVTHLGKYVRNPQGLCNTYHQEALGVPPGKETGDVVALDYHPDEHRDAHGKWVKGAGSFAPTVHGAKPGAPAVPAHVWHKNADGTVVAVSEDGTARLVWHADKKKYVREENANGAGWTPSGASYGKQGAYDVVKSGGWVQPHTHHDPATHVTQTKPTPTPTPTPTVKNVTPVAPPVVAPAPMPTSNKSKTKLGKNEFYDTSYASGEVVGYSPSGTRRYYKAAGGSHYKAQDLQPDGTWKTSTHPPSMSSAAVANYVGAGQVYKPTAPESIYKNSDKQLAGKPTSNPAPAPTPTPVVTPTPPAAQPSVASPSHAPTPKGNKPGKPAVPAHVWQKHEDGAVVAETSSGNLRMVWNASKKKYVVELNTDGSWKPTVTIGKQAAHDELKKNGDVWVQPSESHAPASHVEDASFAVVPDAGSTYAPVPPGNVPYATQDPAVVLDENHPDGTVVGVEISTYGTWRYVWNAGLGKYATEIKDPGTGDWLPDFGTYTPKQLAGAAAKGKLKQPPSDMPPATWLAKTKPVKSSPTKTTHKTAPKTTHPTIPPAPVKAKSSSAVGSDEVVDPKLFFPRPASAPMLSTTQAADLQQTITTPPPPDRHLMPSQRSGLKAYTGSAYHDMNGHLRYGAEVTPSIAKQIKNADDGLKPVDREFTVVRSAGLGAIPGGDPEALVGKTIADSGFFSTSITPGVWPGKVKFQVHVKPGVRGAYVEGFSSHPGEKEFIVAPGTKWKVKRVERSGDLIFIQIEAVT